MTRFEFVYNLRPGCETGFFLLDYFLTRNSLICSLCCKNTRLPWGGLQAAFAASRVSPIPLFHAVGVTRKAKGKTARLLR